jgi:hypothetical protein
MSKLYDMIRSESNEHNPIQSKKLCQEFLNHIGSIWNLNQETLERIKLRSSLRTSHYCCHVHSSGNLKGIKCRNEVEHSDMITTSGILYCKEHNETNK